MSDRKKEILLDTAVELLETCDDCDSITTRMIAERSGANLALINYYYGSKDGLLKAAVGRIMERSAASLYGFADEDDPVHQIVGFISSISKDMFRYRKYTSLFMPDLILHDRIELPDVILPSVRRFFGNDASMQECRMAAYRIIVQAQIIFLRVDEVGRYVGTDLEDGHNREMLLERIVRDTLRRD